MIISSVMGPLMGERVEVFTFVCKFLTLRTSSFRFVIKGLYIFKHFSVTFFVFTYVIVSRHYGVTNPIIASINRNPIIINSLVSQEITNMRVPVMIVPGNFSKDHIALLT